MTIEVTQNFKRPSIFGGAMIITGTAVGAGMFSIPIVTSGVWFTGSIILLVYTCACLYFSGLMILEANMNYPVGASFHTITKDLLGKSWSVLSGLSITFVLYILTYAYVSAGSSIIFHNIEHIIPVKQSIAGLIFAFIVAFIVWLSTKAVDRLSTILIGGMVITFIMSVGGMFTEVKPAILFDQANTNADYLPYALVALPYLLTSFGYHGNIPGLVKYYHKDSKAVTRSLLYGTLITLIIYILWQYVIQGNIPREAFKQIIADGGNIGNLLQQIDNTSNNTTVTQLLNAFSYMALASSFLGVSLGLFDYLADFFKFNDSGKGRFKTALITFVPPTVLALIFPNGFLYAIGFAGLAATIWAVIVPAFVVQASRKRYPTASYRAPGGNFLIVFVILFGLINAVTHVLSLFNLLPTYR
ncbi:tryptophan permease [Xenorhabdus nematophila]|uniref:Aromatic amino acid permease n=1 Tax=Xenorhabdus nematophila (strain ATCC 19061 / DSM 3370 / CCUG 14189 / LMG 1036 / NCIMB 9965 / AN6) TaxID=406817 RepID=D3VIW5_XENNA|nr:tryptophan permease [Xenorhabdus nematophila]CBJ90822.1 tryptophan-specific transport protein (HAAAP family) [Xenorhabdus nematophila ATCC 19061]CCW29318.1 Tryptophan-specific transport protein [Xenorhabdus nematophila F1]CEE90250.1 tryptophan-specific transport protein (HAAAP family) [Xenorhabdus nematophila str. Anatoliense]CEE92318.1 tryptophan-specific transport protein (HAAAP family) [Xenorhabdus nematophila str. Anatoliense]